jgi:formate dehydrogenase subunit delta
MSHSTSEKLVIMANQIGKFFDSQPPATRVPGIADHIRKFWDPRMREQIFIQLDGGGAGIDPVVREALETLRQKAN